MTNCKCDVCKSKSELFEGICYDCWGRLENPRMIANEPVDDGWDDEDECNCMGDTSKASKDMCQHCQWGAECSESPYFLDDEEHDDTWYERKAEGAFGEGYETPGHVPVWYMRSTDLPIMFTRATESVAHFKKDMCEWDCMGEKDDCKNCWMSDHGYASNHVPIPF